MAEASNLTVERELTYLAKTLPEEVKGVAPLRILDIYVPEAGRREYTLRLRQKGHEYEVTKKQPVSQTDYSVQTEQTIPLDRGEFEALSLASHRRVEKKDRYQVLIDGHTADVDVFTGDLRGLVVIDFEFASLAAKQAFIPPACCLADVTQEFFIAGGQLAGKSYDDIAAKLEWFGYQPIAAA